MWCCWTELTVSVLALCNWTDAGSQVCWLYYKAPCGVLLWTSRSAALSDEQTLGNHLQHSSPPGVSGRTGCWGLEQRPHCRIGWQGRSGQTAVLYNTQVSHQSLWSAHWPHNMTVVVNQNEPVYIIVNQMNLLYSASVSLHPRRDQWVLSTRMFLTHHCPPSVPGLSNLLTQHIFAD